MALFYVCGAVWQTVVPRVYVLIFVVLNFIGWLIADGFGFLPTSAELPAVYIAVMISILLTGLITCVVSFLRTEAELAAEIANRYAELAQTKANLEREEHANSAKSTFLTNISHELRTPLGAIVGYADLLVSEWKPSGEAGDFLEIIRRNSTQLTKVVDDLLDMAKVEAGKVSIEKRAFSPRETCNELEKLLGLSASKKKISLKVSCADAIPEWLFADPLRLRQILINVIANAIKYTDAGRVDVNFEYRLAHGGELIVHVCDTGRGISPSEQLRLFKPFSQADDSMSRRFGGTGIGLDLSRRLARIMDGDLVLTSSEPRIGSVFTLRLPAPITVPPEEALMKSEPALVQKRLKGLRILVVDDSSDNQRLICKYLHAEGADTGCAGDGVEGIQEASSGRYDLMLLDIQMPILDGLKTTTILRQKGFSRPIIALTAHAMKEDRDRCLASGCDSYLTKPVDRDLLIKTVARFAREFRRQHRVSNNVFETIQ